jgi:hypothetical protein
MQKDNEEPANTFAVMYQGLEIVNEANWTCFSMGHKSSVEAEEHLRKMLKDADGALVKDIRYLIVNVVKGIKPRVAVVLEEWNTNESFGDREKVPENPSDEVKETREIRSDPTPSLKLTDLDSSDLSGKESEPTGFSGKGSGSGGFTLTPDSDPRKW